MPRARSIAWAHFDTVDKGSYKHTQVQCRHCRRQFAGQAGKMDSHLKRCPVYAVPRACDKSSGLPAGPIADARRSKSRCDKSSGLPAGPIADARQSNSRCDKSSGLPAGPIADTRQSNSREQAQLDKQLGLAIFAGGLPFETFDKDKQPHMWELLHSLNPSYRIPDRHKVADELLPACYIDCQARVKKLLLNCQWINLTCDGSDDKAPSRITNLSVNLPGYGAIFLKDFHTQDNRQSAEFLMNVVLPDIIDSCNGDTIRVNSLATDTCLTMKRLHSLLAADPRFSHTFLVPCDSHGIQRLIEKILELPYYANIFESARAIVAAFSKSRLQLGILRYWQANQYDGKHLALILSVVTRWGSHYGLLNSLLRSKDALKLYASDQRANLRNPKKQSLTHLLLQRDFWSRIEDLEEILRPLHEAQGSSESDSSHIGHVTKRWIDMKKSLTQLYESGKQNYLQSVLSPTGVFTEVHQQQTTDIHWVAYALDPVNTPALISPPMQSRIFEFIRRHLTVDDETWVSILQDYFAFQQKEGAFSEHSAPILWERHLTESPKTFWQFVRGTCPLLAGFAVRIFSTPCNSVPRERAFSATNYLIDKIRAGTGVERSDESLYIYMNQRALDRVALKPRYRGIDELSDTELIEWEDEVLAIMEAKSETEQEEHE